MDRVMDELQRMSGDVKVVLFALLQFYKTRVPGPFLRSYNVPNDCIRDPSARCVQSEQQVAWPDRY